jgi:hypothetical protein
MSTIEQYLNRLRQTVPRHLRDEVTREAASHLEEAVHELQAQGLSRLEAEASAVTQFGQPRHISSRWRQVTGIVEWPDILLAALPILGITGLGWTLAGQYIPLALYVLIFLAGAVVAWRRGWPTWWYAWLGWLFLAVMILPDTLWLFAITFPVLVTIIAVDNWQQATFMTLPFTTYIAFATLISRQPLYTTGWGPGSIYPGNIVWLETAFSLLWIVILVASLRAARPSRRGAYLLFGLISTQAIYVGGLLTSLLLAYLLPDYFISTLTARSMLLVKLPIAAAILGLTIYPLFVWFIAHILRQRNIQPGLQA